MIALPSVVTGALASAMVTLAVVYVGRMMLGRRCGSSVAWVVETCHLLMAMVMGAMFLGLPLLLPSELWSGIFCAFAAVFACQLVVGLVVEKHRTAAAHDGAHLVLAGAMVYVLSAMHPMSVISVADLICGSRMLDTASGPTLSSLPLPALALGALCFGFAGYDVFISNNQLRQVAASVLATNSSAVPTAAPRAPVPTGQVQVASASAPDSPQPDPVSVTPHFPLQHAWLLGPRATAGYHAVMAVAMGLMFVTMH